MKLSRYVNGTRCHSEIAPGTTLLEFLRGKGLMGAKAGCDTGSCGLCTVWVDEVPILSCTYPAARAQGKHVTTIEGMRQQAALLGRYLAENGSEQCGYCSPGLIMTVLALEKEHPAATDAEISAYLAGNLCRCSGYAGQLAGIRAYLNRGKGALE